MAEFPQRIQQLFKDFYARNETRGNDLMTVRSQNLQILGRVLKEAGFSWSYITQLFKTHTPVHPDLIPELIAPGDESIVLSQSFVPNDKLVRILKQLAGNANQTTHLDELLAVDGLSGNLSNGPNFDHKNYISNLTFSRNGNKSDFDEQPEYKRLHAQAIRKMYKEFKSSGETQPTGKHIYMILRNVVKDMAKVDLPELVDENVKFSKQAQEKCTKLYRAAMTANHVQEMVKNLRWRGNKRAVDEDDVVPVKMGKMKY